MLKFRHELSHGTNPRYIAASVLKLFFLGPTQLGHIIASTTVVLDILQSKNAVA